MKETLKVAFLNFWPEWTDEDFISPILRETYDIVIDNKNPDIVFHSVFGQNKLVDNYKCKKILFLGENYRPSQFKTDYSISFDVQTKTNFRLPLWQVFILNNPTYWYRLINRKHHESFDYFGAFTVSNPSNLLRINHYEQLHSYRSMMSYGKVRTNSLKLQSLYKGKYWRDAKDEFFLKNPHQFMMTYENTSYPWYCTEKLMDAFLVGSLPIYWGDPKVTTDWNENAFINVQKLGGDWLNTIKKLTTDTKLFNDMYNQPVFTGSQIEKHFNNMNEFKEWLIKIVK